MPVPTVDMLISPDSSRSIVDAITSFCQLCGLTSILGDMLPMIYSLKPDYQEAWKSIRRIECRLDEWEDALPAHFSFTKSETCCGSGSGLWFCFLSLKVMLHRLAFKVSLREPHVEVRADLSKLTAQGGEQQSEVKNYRFAVMRSSAISVIDYVVTLVPAQLSEFWLPCESKSRNDAVSMKTDPFRYGILACLCHYHTTEMYRGIDEPWRSTRLLRQACSPPGSLAGCKARI